MRLPTLQELDVFGKRVLLRMDTDVPVVNNRVADDTRLRASIPTVKYLVEEGCGQIIVLGHRVRPPLRYASRGKLDEKVIKAFSLRPVAEHLEKLLEKELGKDFEKLDMYMAENLRFFKGEEANRLGFAEGLAQNGDIYVNDAFAASERAHASIVGLPEVLPSAAGFSLIKEVESLEKILKNPKKPVVVVLGGGKADKAHFIPKFLEIADWVLVGGLLAKYVDSYCTDTKHGGACVAAAYLGPHYHDITPDSAHNFVEIIKSAGTLVWNGPMGDIDSGYWDATKVIAQAVADSPSYTVVGGGDTLHVVSKMKLSSKINQISVGGGAMLEFLAHDDLPGLKALRE